MSDASIVFQLSADHVALDFINTLDDRFAPQGGAEKLGNYSEFLRFATQAELLTAAQAASLSRAAKVGDAAGTVAASIDTRELLARIFYAVARRKRVAGRDLETFNERLREISRHRILVEEVGQFAWRWERLDKDLAAPLWPIVQEAGNLLASPQLIFVRECGSEACRWLFLDTSKNHSRRWCNMKTCGNRTKARRYYALHGRE